MDWSLILSTFSTAVIIPVITLIGTYLIKWIKKKIQQEELERCIKITNDCVKDSVREISQTYVSKLDKSEWNAETKAQAFDLAKNSILESMGKGVKSTVEKNIGDFDSWLKSKIEAEVHRQNSEKIQ
jgi:hypothetical protein